MTASVDFLGVRLPGGVPSKIVWFVLTPAGEAGPYYRRTEAQNAARPFGWVVVRRHEEEAGT